MEIGEGAARVLVPSLRNLGAAAGYNVWDSPVFYNPLMKLNRDLSVLALHVFQQRLGQPMKVCEPLAGTGIRGIRWAKELDGLESAVLNDASLQAYRLIRRNVKLNGLERQIHVRNSDANLLLEEYASKTERFDVIDLDPFGSPMPFIAPAIEALKRHSLLAVTATDTAPLCGVKPDACLRKYGSKPLRTPFAHEVAARILIGAVARIAGIYEFAITPLLTHSTDHYIRCYLELKMGVTRANKTSAEIGFLWHCKSCAARGITSDWRLPESICPHCGSAIQIAGPLWTGLLQEPLFCSQVKSEAELRFAQEHQRLLSMLNLLLEEAEAAPLYYDLDEICDRIGTPNPAFKMLFGLLEARGYRATRTHFKPKGFRTDAPIQEVEGTIREACSGSDQAFAAKESPAN